jgi:predicted Co/Zn/Cd cation transporter (cation efflux family)
VAWALILELSTATAAEDKIKYSVECLQLILGILTMAMFCVSESSYSIFYVLLCQVSLLASLLVQDKRLRTVLGAHQQIFRSKSKEKTI